MLTRSLGPTAEVVVDCSICEDGPARGDFYLLCSDGLYNLVTNEEILNAVLEKDVEEALQSLIDLANQRGGTDNITIIIIEIDSSYPRSVSDFPQAKPSSVDFVLTSSPDDETDAEVSPHEDGENRSD